MHLTAARPLLICYSLLLDPPSATSKCHASVAEEVQARDFAMTLLMPESRLIEDLRREAPDATSRDQLIERLARRFEVSNEATGFRLITLGVAAA